MNSQSAQLFAFVSIVTGCLVTVFWMVVGWRAMRAHEKIAASMSEDVEQKANLIRSSLRSERSGDERSFRDFLAADPVVRHLDSTEQMRRFAEWKKRTV